MSTAAGINRRIELNVTESLMRRFWSRVQMGDRNECWPWTAGMRNGYGAIKHENKVFSAHRVAYILANGTPEKGLVIAHKCDNRKCCNPSHLEAITPGQNNTDARGRCVIHFNRGEQIPTATLTEQDVRNVMSMRKATGHGARVIGRNLNLPESAVKRVITGVTWRHITGL